MSGQSIEDMQMSEDEIAEQTEHPINTFIRETLGIDRELGAIRWTIRRRIEAVLLVLMALGLVYWVFVGLTQGWGI